MSAPPINPALAMQLNVKQNAQEINSYLKDLQSWSSDVKKKDAALKSGDLTLTKTPIAPIRGSAGSAAAATTTAAKATPVLLPSSASADQLRFAESKAAGNKAFAAGAFEDSLGHYATCMILDPRDAIVPSNRAQALLKLQRWHEAEVDASTALAIDSGAVKALFRRAQARRQLRKYAGALSDCELLAKLDPSNKAAQALAVEVAALLKKQQEAKLKASQPIVSAAPVAPIAVATKPAPASAAASASPAASAAGGPASAGSLPAGRRMVIQEEDDDDDDVEELITPAAAAATAAANAAAAAKAASAAAAASEAAPSTAAAPSASAASKPAAATSAAPAVASSAAAPSSPAAAASSSSSAAAAGSGSVSLRAPKTAYDFDSAFREIHGDPSAVAAYLALLPAPAAQPAAYPTLLKTALSSSLLRDVTESLSVVIVPEGRWVLARDVLQGVSSVPRFATVRMMMDESDKQTLKQLFAMMHAQAAQGAMGATTKEAVQAIAKSWGVAL